MSAKIDVTDIPPDPNETTDLTSPVSAGSTAGRNWWPIFAVGALAIWYLRKR